MFLNMWGFGTLRNDQGSARRHNWIETSASVFCLFVYFPKWGNLKNVAPGIEAAVFFLAPDGDVFLSCASDGTCSFFDI